MDQYGGLLAAHSPNGGTGHFRVEKFGNGWMFVTPDGNAFWSFGVFNVAVDTHVDVLGNTYQNRVITKYGDADKTWGPQQVRRLRSWGLNTILDHYNLWVHPVQTCGGCLGWQNGQPEKMPAVWFIDGAGYPLRNVLNYAPQGAKDIFHGVNSTYYNGYNAPNTDPFDPNFVTWINTYMKSGEAATAARSPWVIGFSLAESDYIWGFGAGSTASFATVPPGHNGPHLSWIVLITSPTQTSNPTWGATYADTTVYAKQALKNFLQGRYATIAALNTAWGSNYTSFDSAGGWGTGTGLLDEDGRHSWVPRHWDNLTGATAAMKQDLDDFLFQYASQWFKTQRNALKAAFPNMLYLGPNVVGSWGTPPRRQILQAAGQSIDVFMTEVGTGAAEDQQRLDFMMQYLGDKPVASWFGITANPDSAMYQYPNPQTFLTASTQSQRAQIYSQMLNWFLNATVSASVPGVGGTKPYIGLRWWAWLDNPTERADWGLVTPLDNLYDGKEAIIARGVDPWGYPTGGEADNYGDFLSAVRSANFAALQALIARLKPNLPAALNRRVASSAFRASCSPSEKARQGSREPRCRLANVATSAQPRLSQVKQSRFLVPLRQ